MTTVLSVQEVSASYGELVLVEAPAIDLFASLGWSTANLYTETFGKDGTEGRLSESEVILVRRLRTALERLNPGLPVDAFTQAIDELARDRSKQLPATANREFYRLLHDRVKVQVTDDEGNPQTVELKVIDWEHPENNEFFLGQQMWVAGDMYRRRCDLLGFVNGIPLVFVELKAPHVPLKSAFDDNLRDYRGQSVPQLFHPNAFILLSNGTQTKIGTLTSEWEHFFEWKRVTDEEEAGSTSLETAIRGLCDKARLLDMVENFTLFEEARGGLIKKVAKNHQYLGVNKAIEQMLRLRKVGAGGTASKEDKDAAKRLGVFWHTQGSGKSLSMVFFTQKILRRLPGKWTFVIVTDRNELGNQIYKTFTNVGAISGPAVEAESAEHLKTLLGQTNRYVFSLIQKFRTEKGSVYPQVSPRDDIIVITDEAHRSQYDVFALNMRNALPNAAFLGFTGTPLISGEEERTREVFGDYISVYDFARSIEDGATVPLYYENRIPELELKNENLNEDMQRLLEEAELDEDQEKKLEREFAREYHLITRDERLDTVAKDVVAHFTGRGYRGKAMFVCIDKATAVRMYDKVQKHWRDELAVLKGQLKRTKDIEAAEAIRERIGLMESTDMAVVVSQGQNEIEDLKKKGLDIVPHRQRMLKEALDEKFKDPNSELRLVFVCAMWITGFDVPTCSTLYLDKPMRNHTLMQTIARANRVAPGKTAGLIVDYVGIFRNLQAALMIYAQTKRPGEMPINDKAALVAQLQGLLAQARQFCLERGIQLKEIVAAAPMKRLPLLQAAVDAIIGSEQDKKLWMQIANAVARIFKAILPDQAANAHAPEAVLVAYLGAMIKALNPKVSIDEIMADVEALLNDSIATEGYRIGNKPKPEAIIDLSQIDFGELEKKFAQGKKRTEAEKLKGQIEQKLAQMVQINKARVDFMEKFQKLIAEYNSGSHNLDAFFNDLLAFAQGLNEEDQRAAREGLTDEELTLFDLLTQPEPKLTDREKAEVKKVARALLEKLKREKLVLDWRLKAPVRADVERTIRDEYRALPGAYSEQLRREKRNLTYAHIYDNYFGIGKSVFSGSQTGT
jgi:type I restriction enzyme R subunit